MAQPFFYKKDLNETDATIVLDEDTSKHIAQVLRMQIGEQIKLTDGKGNIYNCSITNDHRKKCEVSITEKNSVSKPQFDITIAISPVKNNSRLEWFLEKATEIGVAHIVPLICERTEKQQLKRERLNGILISAMLQSQQAWLPVLHESVKISDYISGVALLPQQKFIAHCEEISKTELSATTINAHAAILIGPEGDFTSKEIDAATAAGFQPVSLGNTRLRTETAGMVAAVLMRKT